jgi:hypothetical protein
MFPSLAAGCSMSQRWWGVGLIVVLGLVWFALEERPDGATGEARAQAPVSLKLEQPAAPEAQSAPAPDVRPAEVAPAVQEPAKPAPPAATPPDSDALNRALALSQAGDSSGAAAALKDLILHAKSLPEGARAGLFLAPLIEDPAQKRQYLSTALEAGVVYGAEFEQVGKQLRELNRRPAESLHKQIASVPYTVVSGDSLWKLCNRTIPDKFHVSPEVGLVKLVNGLGPGALSAGQTLRIPTESLTVRVDATQHGLVAWLGDVAVAAYRVGLGRDDRTPRRTFTVEVKQENPVWYFNGKSVPFGDPENILGTRWMGFDKQPGATGFGIHGTTLPESIGKNESMGCVRMRNAEVEELFEIVARGTKVTIS